jgi:hypothetical protein
MRKGVLTVRPFFIDLSPAYRQAGRPSPEERESKALAAKIKSRFLKFFSIFAIRSEKSKGVYF